MKKAIPFDTRYGRDQFAAVLASKGVPLPIALSYGRYIGLRYRAATESALLRHFATVCAAMIEGMARSKPGGPMRRMREHFEGHRSLTWYEHAAEYYRSLCPSMPPIVCEP